MTLTAELAACQREASSKSGRAAELERLLHSTSTASDELHADLAALKAASERAASSETAARVSEQAAREELESCRSACNATFQLSLLCFRMICTTMKGRMTRKPPIQLQPFHVTARWCSWKDSICMQEYRMTLMVSCRHQLEAQHADVESHLAHAQALEGQLAALESKLQAAEEQARDATSGLALAQMTAEQARADATRCVSLLKAACAGAE